MRRWPHILIALFLGVLLTVLVALIVPRFGPETIITNVPPSNMEPLVRKHPAVGVLANDMTLTGFGRQQFRGWAFDREVIYATDGTKNRSIVRGRTGWPFRCFEGSETTGIIGYRNGISIDFLPFISTTARFRGLSFIPTGVMWPGMLANVAVFALLAFPLTCAPGRIRRWRRDRRGLCPQCAYPSGTSTVCTECGNALPGNTHPITGETPVPPSN